MIEDDYLVSYDDPILITGAAGFIGSRVVESLLRTGFTNLRCFVRVSSNLATLRNFIGANKGKIQLIEGNLLSRDDCKRASEGVRLVFHLAAGIEKTFPGCYMNSVITTRNLLEALLESGNIKRFVNVSSIAVYSNRDTKGSGTLDETSEVEGEAALRHEAYVYGKAKQDELVLEYSNKFGMPYVIVRPGEVFGPGKRKISGRVGIGTFGVFLHLGGRGQIPLTYVENCAEAIVLAGIRRDVRSLVFNIVDNDLPTSREFLRDYKRNVQKFRSIFVPYGLTYLLCYLWEKYSAWSKGQVPPVFNRRQCIASWKRVRYSNVRVREELGWRPSVSMKEGLKRYFEYMKVTGGSF